MKNNRKSILGTILVLLAAACWSIIGLFVRTLSEAGLDVWDITLVRIGVGHEPGSGGHAALHRADLCDAHEPAVFP